MVMKDKETPAARSKRWRQEHPDRARASELKWQKSHPENVQAIQFRHYHKNKVKISKRRKQAYKPSSRSAVHLKNRYGITLEERDRLWKAQNQKCAICGKYSKRPLHIDHNHRTEEIRGLLCQKCNTGLGMFQDSSAILRLAFEYLERYGSYGE